MDKTQTLDKSAAADVEVIDMSEKLCRYCGLEMTPWRCRYVSNGFWCQQVGLKFDMRRLLGQPPPDILADLVEQDRSVKKALAEYERLTAEADRLTDQWERLALEELTAKRRRLANKQEVVVDGRLVSWSPPGTPTPGDIRQLTERQEQANLVREHAAEQALKARRALEVARARARARLKREGR
jgi:hypothetical protein